jgi:isoleucyl-tRNA synthetase
MQIISLPSLRAEANLFVSSISCYNSAMKTPEHAPIEGRGMFDPLGPQASLIRLEEEVRRVWKRRDLPAAVRAARHAGPSQVICVQPLATGQSHADQVRLLAAADLLARYQTMQGAAVRRRAGWAGHGLAVEVAVERSLGPEVTGLEEAAFSNACRELARGEVMRGERLAGELGLWLDPDDVYVTLTPGAVGTVWSALHRLWQAGRLRLEQRVVPFCPRCATPLSEAEAARNAFQAEAMAAWLLLPWEDQPGAYFLVWTPAPWTLVGMVALAAHPEASYVLVELPSRSAGAPRRLLLAEAALRRLKISEYQRVRRLPGKALRGTGYYPPFTFVPAGEGLARIVLSEEVSLEQGSGLMPVTPSFEARSLALAVARNLPVPHLLDDWGRLDGAVSPWRGLSPLDVAPLVIENLRARGLLFREEEAPATRSQCPYCQAPLLPLARRVWLAETESGPWFLSRDRSWGTPLPIWTCDGCGETTCLAGLDDLAHRAGVEASQIDLHRPEVDRVTFSCERCGGTMHRVPEIIDAEFEAAVVPWAAGLAREATEPGLAVCLEERCPDWLDDMLEVAALLGSPLAWEQAVPLSKGQAWPDGEAERRQAADARRWAAYAGLTPEQAEEVFLRPLWGLAAADDAPPVGAGRPTPVGALLDRWLQARLFEVAGATARALDAADPGRAAEHLAALPGDLTGWYVPHHPRGGLPAGPVGDEMVSTLSRLLAPCVPHLAEAISVRLASQPAGGTEVDSSVHLAAWPDPPPAWQDSALLAQVALVRRLAVLGGAARATAGLEAGQPLRHGVVHLGRGTAARWPGPGALQDLLAQALVVDGLEVLFDTVPGLSWHLSLTPGREPAREVSPATIAQALATLGACEAAELAEQLRAGLSIRLQASGQAITLLPDEVQVIPQAPPGWAAAADDELVVSLKLKAV